MWISFKRDKFEAMPMCGYCPSIIFSQWKFLWPPKRMKYLGMYITGDYKDKVQETLSHLNKMKVDLVDGTKFISPYEAEYTQLR